MKRLVIVGLIVCTSLTITGCTVKDKISSLLCGRSTADNLNLNSDRFISATGLDIKSYGTIKEDDNALERSSVLAKMDIDSTYPNYTGSIVSADVVSALKENMKCETLIGIFASQDISNLNYVCVPDSATSDIVSYIKDNKDNLTNDVRIADSLAKKNFLLLPVHVGSTGVSTALYWTDKHGKLQAVGLKFDSGSDDSVKKSELSDEDYQSIIKNNSNAVVSVGNTSDTSEGDTNNTSEGN